MIMEKNSKCSRELLVNSELVRLLYSHVTTANIVTIFVALVLVFIQWTVIPHRVLLNWLGFIVIVSLFRLGQSYFFHRTPENVERSEFWKNWYIFTTFCSALGWGSSGILLFPTDSMAHQVFLAYVLAGIAAGGMATLSMATWTYVTHLLLVLLPISIHFLIMGGTIHFSLGGMAIVYLLLLLRTAKIMQKTVVESLNLRFQNNDLVEFLSKTKKETEQLNEELETEILEKRRSEITLRESEEKYRMLIELMPQGIVIVQNEKPMFANHVALKIFNIDETRSVAKINIMSLVSKNEQARLGSLLKAKLMGETDLPEHYFAILKRFNGVEFPAEIFVRKISFAGEAAVQVIITDISERKRMEEEVFRARKLESIGIFAGGIAHDFNNLLTGILGNVTLAKVDMSKEDKSYQWLEEAKKASYRAKDLTQQLLTFSRGGAPVKKTASIINLIIDSSLFVLRGSNVKCEFSIPDDLWSVEVDEGQFTQVINNMVINADQAMPEGGIVKITAENIAMEAESGLPLIKGDYVRITVQDQGSGVEDKYLSRIFDPYFSMKEKGSGLGLAVCYSIIRNHGGCITLDSISGEGTAFFIHLPAVPGKTMKIDDNIRQDQLAGSGIGRILVVDDEEMIRKVLGGILEHLGFEPVYAGDGVEALELYRQVMEQNSHFTSVILDLTIPGGMGGEETIKRLLKIHPEAKVIVSSGYSNDPIMADYRNYGFSGVVTKPFDIDEISEVLHEVLNDSISA